MPKIYIFCTGNKLAHCTAVLAQGMLELPGIELHSNLDCRIAVQSSGIFPPKINLDKIITSNHIGDEDILIIDESREIGRVFLEESIRDFYLSVSVIAKRKPVTIFYMSDDANLTKFPDDIRLYISHINSNANLNPSARPLPFVFSLDLLRESERILSLGKPRKKNIINNFNITFNQSVRAVLELALVPTLEKDFAIDYESLSVNDYADRLATSAAIFAYGGAFYQNPATYRYLRELNKDNEIFSATNNFPQLEKRTAVFRWDSWRFWEALAFECPAFQLDFEKYGFMFSVNPKKWEHYIPIDLSLISTISSELRWRLEDNENYLHNLGINARIWALENYHPVNLAKNFLNDCQTVPSPVSS